MITPRIRHCIACNFNDFALVENIFVVGDSLVEQPESGRIVPELNDPNVRERFIYSYRLIYEIKDDDIYIMGVIHGNRLLESVDRFNQ